MQNAHAMAQKWLCALVAAAAATAATSAASGEGGGGLGGGAVPITGGGSEDRELDAGFLAGALGAGDFLLLIDDNLLKAGFALFAQGFVDKHSNCSFYRCHGVYAAHSDI